MFTTVDALHTAANKCDVDAVAGTQVPVNPLKSDKFVLTLYKDPSSQKF